jgi:hypothetical protein
LGTVPLARCSRELVEKPPYFDSDLRGIGADLTKKAGARAGLSTSLDRGSRAQ